MTIAFCDHVVCPCCFSDNRDRATQVATEEPEEEKYADKSKSESVSVTDSEFDRAMAAWVAGMRAKNKLREIENPLYDSDEPSSNIGNSRTDLEMYMNTYVLY